jgi:hypothetical protein
MNRRGWTLGLPTTCTLVALLGACGGDASRSGGEGAPGDLAWSTVQDTSTRLYTVSGLDGPEAVRYDSIADVWLVASFGPSGDEGVGDGFVSRVRAADGTVEALRWAVGGEWALEDPRGMAFTGDTLWVVDDAGLHAFDRVSGAQLGFVDMRSHEPGFLNDVAVGGDGALYVTDTGLSRVYRVAGGRSEIAVEGDALGRPNGITWDAGLSLFVLVPWAGGDTLRAWSPDLREVRLGARTPGGRFDGVEIVDGYLIVASQADSALHVVLGGRGAPFLRVPGAPADIGVDTRRGRVAVPYIALDRVDVWALPPRLTRGG